MTLAQGSDTNMTLLAFAADESVSEEKYFGDTLYYVVEGAACIVLPAERVRVGTGKVLKVDAQVEHAVGGADGGAFKLLQITLP